MRIGCLQFAPQVGEVDNNLNRADSVLSRVDPMELDNLDLLVLPEMAFSGYNFKSLDQIKPFLEHAGSGISSLWARTTALKYDCTVAVGYPEKYDLFQNWTVTSEYYNSLVVVNGDGDTVVNYRKSFLYYTDETWAKEGAGFYRGYIPDLGKTAIGICMDINPYKFEAPWHTFEFAFHILEIKANIVIVSMAWLTFEDSRQFTRLPEEPDMDTLTYWVQRLEPVIRSGNEEEIIVIFCNRCGMEDDVLYAGTSAVLGVKNGEVSVYGLLGRGVKELLVVNTEMPPFAKLVNRPDTPEVSEKESRDQPAARETDATAAPASATAPAPDAQPKEPNKDNAPSRTGGQLGGPQRDEQAMYSEGSSGRGRVQRGNDREKGKKKAPSAPIKIPDSVSFSSSHEATGKAQHSGGNSPMIPTPTAPSPVPFTLRPKVTASTSPDMVSPPIRRRSPPPGIERGNYFTSADLFTPPMSPSGDDTGASSMHYFFPPSTVLDTPHSSIWGTSLATSVSDRSPPAEVPTKIDFNRTPSRTAPSRHSSRTRTSESTDVKSAGIIAERRTGTVSRSPPLNMASVNTPQIERPASAATRQRTQKPRTSKRRSSSEEGRAISRRDGLPPERRHSPAVRQDASSGRPKRDAYRETDLLQPSSLLNSIPIAASPSIFQTTFPRFDTDRGRPSRDRRCEENLASASGTPSGRRSRSASKPAPGLPRSRTQTPDAAQIAVRALSRGRGPDRHGSPAPCLTANQTSKATHPDLKALLISEAVALSGAASRSGPKEGRRRRAPTPVSSRRPQSCSPAERELQARIALLDMKSPISV